MTTPIKSNAELVLLEDGGEKYILKFGMRTLMLLQQEVDFDLDDDKKSKSKMQDMNTLVGILRVLLNSHHPHLTNDDVIDKVMERLPGANIAEQLSYATSKVMECFKLAFGESIGKAVREAEESSGRKN